MCVCVWRASLHNGRRTGRDVSTWHRAHGTEFLSVSLKQLTFSTDARRKRSVHKAIVRAHRQLRGGPPTAVVLQPIPYQY